jgi:hypothetical protein
METEPELSAERRRFAPLVKPAPSRKAPEKHRGAQAELIACTYLLGEGYEVFRNISSCGPADIIACKGAEMLRIDVKSGTYHTKLSEAQRRDGVVMLYVGADGGCEFDFERERHFADAVRATLAKVEGLTPGAASVYLAERGERTPGNGQWSAGTVAQMRQRFAIS